MIARSEARKIAGRVARLADIEKALGLEDLGPALRAIGYRTLERASSFDWFAAGLTSGQLVMADAYERLITLAYTFAYQHPELGANDVMAKAMREWARNENADLMLRWQRREAGGGGAPTAVAALDPDDYTMRLSAPDHADDVASKVDAERELERLMALLTPRQRRIVVLVADGYSYPEIADLGVATARTVQREMTRIREVAGTVRQPRLISQ